MSESTTTAPVTGEATTSQAIPGTTSSPTGPGVTTTSDAAKEAMRKFKVKVDGVESEVDELELVRGYSHQKAANKKLQEGLTLRKQAEEFLSMMRDPDKYQEVTKKLGHDPRQLAEKYLAQQLADEIMDPRDKELRDTKAKLKQIEEMDRQQKEAVENKRNEALKAKYAQDYSEQFIDALKTSGLPSTKPMIAEMAKYVHRASKIGFKMTPQEASQLVREDLQIAHANLVGGADGEMLLKLLGDEVANKIRKYDTDKLRSPEQHLRTPQNQSVDTNDRGRTSSGKRMTPKEWADFKRRR